jgi:hypothetical protein
VAAAAAVVLGPAGAGDSTHDDHDQWTLALAAA